MTTHVLKFVQGGSPLVDFVELAKFAVISFEPDLEPVGLAQSAVTFNLRGTSNDDMADNLIALDRAILAAHDNAARIQQSKPHTPIFMQVKTAGQTNTLQTELLDAKWDRPGNWFAPAVLANRQEKLRLNLTHRPYLEESAEVVLQNAQAFSNNGVLIDIPNTIRGDLPCPVKILCRAGAAGVTRLLASLRAPASGTVANFLSKLEAEAYTARGSGVADLTDATFSGTGAPQGQKWTPGGTAEQMLLRWQISSNVVDQLGPQRVLVAGRDNSAAPNTLLRVKPFTYSGTTRAYGDWGGSGLQKYALAVGSRVLVDCDVVGWGDTAGLAPSGIGLELWGKAALTGASNTFDVDCIYLLPVSDGGDESGYFSASYPLALGNGAQPDGVLDANDRVPHAALVDGSGNLVFMGQDYRGEPLLAYPNRAQKLIVLAVTEATLAHAWNNNNTLTVSVTPRYRLARGTS